MNPQLLIKPPPWRIWLLSGTLADLASIWRTLEPTIRAGETYALPPDISEADAVAYWMGPGRQVFLAERDGRFVRTYFLCANQPGGCTHVANCG